MEAFIENMTPLCCLKHMCMVVAGAILLRDMLLLLLVLNADFLQVVTRTSVDLLG